MHIELQRVTSGDGFAPMAQTLTVRGNTVIVDGTTAEGGDDTGPNPHDLYDAALGACKALTVLWYARRKGIPVGEVQTVVERDDSGDEAHGSQYQKGRDNGGRSLSPRLAPGLRRNGLYPGASRSCK